MISDPKIGWPAKLALGGDGLGNSPDHIAHIMGQSMEALIHHFKLVTEGFRVPAGQVYTAVESPRGELGCHAVSDGGTRPYRAHFRDPSFTNLQAVAAMAEGGMVADVIPGRGQHRPSDGRGGPVMALSQEVRARLERTPHRSSAAIRVAVGAAAAAAPDAGRGGLPHPGRHRVLR